ncbi:MAG: hypothetical protein VB027_08805 [Gordonibacter sp.]|nr:hypothetical protein [Gordonibacter sp.]
MNENEFRTRYTKAQESIGVSASLKERAITGALCAGDIKSERYSAGPNSPSRQDTKNRPAPSKRPAPRRRPLAPGDLTTAVTPRRWAWPAAACLVAVTLVVAGIPVLGSLLREDRSVATAIALDDAAARCGFSVRAFADDGSEIIKPGEGDMIMFDRNWWSGTEENVFTGCLFRVKGEGIARIQMNVSGGELYRQDTESFTQSEDPERWQAATTWKPNKRGMAGYYEDYDAIYPLTDLSDESIPLDSPDKPLRVNMLKRYGSTIDVATAENQGIASGETSFGLCANTGMTPTTDDEGKLLDPQSVAIDQFEGQRLTVTVTFEDGRVATQVIELHTADFRADHYGNNLMVTTETIDRTDPQNQEIQSAHCVYGIVVAASNEPFPLPLENANEYAGQVTPAPTINRQPDTYRIGGDTEENRADVVIDRNSLLKNGNTADTSSMDDNQVSTPLTVSCPTVVRSDRPLDGKMLAEFEGVVNGFRGDATYMNQCTQQRSGYGFNEDGTLTDSNYCYLSATFNVTNNSDIDAAVHPFGDYAVLDEEGHCSIVDTSYDLDYTVSDNALPGSGHGARNFTIAAGDTVQLTILRVLPNYLADNPDLLFVLPKSLGGISAFAIGDQV